MQFTDYAPVKVVFGPGKLDALRTEPLPGTKALILTSNGTAVERIGALGRVKSILRERDIAFDHLGIVEPNPQSTTVMQAAAFVRENACDFIIALGGGSVMDCAKAVAIMATNDGDLWDYIQSGTGGRRAIENMPIPMIAVTTTAGTGSEVDAGGVISNAQTQEKTAIGHPGCYPRLAIVDPELMLSVPPRLTALQGFDAFFHAVEGYVTKRPNLMGDMYALESVRHVSAHLPHAVRNGQDLDARTHVAFANTLSGFVMTVARLTSQHAMEHAMSALHPELPHGAGLIMLSMAYFTHMIHTGAQSDRFVALARAMGMSDAISADDFLKCLYQLQVDCGVADLKMSDFGITEDELPLLAENARLTGPSAFENDPVALTFEDTLAIYQAAYR